MSEPTYTETLGDAIGRCGTRLCVGVDPHIRGLPPFLQKALTEMGPEEWLARFSDTMLEAASGIAPAVKIQTAFYEAHGSAGWRALERACQAAKKRGFVVIADAKRGDIRSTMEAYGQGIFERLGADAMTVTPYMGFAVIEALRPWLTHGRGAYVVWVTSNPEGATLQERRVAAASGSVPLSRDLYKHFLEQCQAQSLDEGALGWVLGLTRVQALGDSLLEDVVGRAALLPGMGAQGGVVTSRLRRALGSSHTALFPVSRGLSGLGGDAESVESWEDYARFVRDRVRETAATLAV